MPSVEAYQNASGVRRYRARWRDENRRDREKAGFQRKKDAENFLADLSVSLRGGTYVDPSAARSEIRSLGPGWLEAKVHLKESSRRPLEIAWRVHVEPEWGRRRIGDIRHSEIQSWVNRLSKEGRSATTVIRAFGVLAGILDVAVLDRRLAATPAASVKLPRKRKKAPAYLTLPQLELLADNARDHRVLVLLLGYAGLRWGEATGLRVRHINFLKRRVMVEENAVEVGGRIVVTTPKTHERREISIPQFLVDELATQATGRSADSLLFGTGLSHLHHPDSRTGWFTAAVRRSQAIDTSMLRVTPHDLRHTAASIAIDAGANVMAVAKMLGHASPKMTLDTYADLFDTHADEVSRALDAARSRAIVGNSWGSSL